MKKVLVILILLQSCIGAGDMFAGKIKINENYWLIEDEEGGYVMCYRAGESYVVRGPSRSKVAAYAIKDSLLVMKSLLPDSSMNFYVINMKRDCGYTKDELIFVDTVKVNDYRNSWLSKLNLELKQVED